MELLRRAYPDGLPSEDYMPLLAALHESFSNRSLATLVAAVTGIDYSVIDNDHAAAFSSRPQLPADVARVRARLDAVGFDYDQD